MGLVYGVVGIALPYMGRHDVERVAEVLGLSDEARKLAAETLKILRDKVLRPAWSDKVAVMCVMLKAEEGQEHLWYIPPGEARRSEVATYSVACIAIEDDTGVVNNIDRLRLGLYCSDDVVKLELKDIGGQLEGKLCVHYLGEKLPSRIRVGVDCFKSESGMELGGELGRGLKYCLLRPNPKGKSSHGVVEASLRAGRVEEELWVGSGELLGARRLVRDILSMWYLRKLLGKVYGPLGSGSLDIELDASYWEGFGKVLGELFGRDPRGAVSDYVRSIVKAGPGESLKVLADVYGAWLDRVNEAGKLDVLVATLLRVVEAAYRVSSAGRR